MQELHDIDLTSVSTFSLEEVSSVVAPIMNQV